MNMNTLDLHEILSSDRTLNHLFRGVFALDHLLERISTGSSQPSLYIFNNQPSHKPGEHWMLLFTVNGKAWFFDSFGRHPLTFPLLGVHLGEIFTRVVWNNLPLQGKSTTACGDYCILLAKQMARGYSFKQCLGYLKLLGDDKEERDHNARAIILRAYGSKSLASYRNYPSALAGYQGLHIKSMMKTTGTQCTF